MMDLIVPLRTTPHSFYTLGVGPSFGIYEVVAVVDRKMFKSSTFRFTGFVSFPTTTTLKSACDGNGMIVLSLRGMCPAPDSGSRSRSALVREVETCSQALSSLCVILTHLKTLISWSDPGCLFPKDERSPQELLTDSPGFNQICFYGTCLGFQFCESMQAILKGLSILMVSFSEVYYSEGGMLERATNYLWHSKLCFFCGRNSPVK
ncbi:hypothetical protein J6590_028462 [Homalodisca vitripennis]|nr:hypothetical protein J6590_028462 [Homalodisca vitripennis]